MQLEVRLLVDLGVPGRVMISFPVYNRSQQQNILALGCRPYTFPPKFTDPHPGSTGSWGNRGEPSVSLGGSGDRIEEKREHTNLPVSKVW